MKKYINFIFLYCLPFFCKAQEAVFPGFTTNHPDSKIVFKYETKKDALALDIKVQDGGTCWCFSGISFMEAEIFRQTGKWVDLSEKWIIYHVYLSKAEAYLERDGKLNFGEGGEFWDVLHILDTYGFVPESAAKWEPVPDISKLHEQLKEYVEYLVAYYKIHGKYPEWKTKFREMLGKSLGKMPETFEHEGKDWTPRTFAQSLKVLGSDYVNFMCDTRYPNYGEAVVQFADNWFGGEAINLPVEEFGEIPMNALKNGGTFEWATDVSNQDWRFKYGIASNHGRDTTAMSVDERKALWLNPIREVKVTSEIRQAGVEEHSTMDDHGMHALALVYDQNSTPYFVIKNSWGKDKNQCGGYLFASLEYFKHYTTVVTVHQDYIPERIKTKINKQER